MDDLEDRLVAWVDASIDGVAPVTADEVLRGVDERAFARSVVSPRRRLLALAAVVVALLGGVAEVAITRHPPEHVVSVGPSRDRWVRTTIEPFGWTISQPATWTLQPWDTCGHGTGRIISNHATPLRHKSMPLRCFAPWRSPDLADRHLAAVEILREDPGGPASPTAPGRADTVLPIAARELFDNGETVADATVRVLPVRVQSQSFGIRTILGHDASPADRAAIRRMVASIRWPVDRSTGHVRGIPARWPDTPSTRQGPSQTAADARRDRIVPALAALPLGRRATPLQGVRADEGDWWIVDGNFSAAQPHADTGVLGDPKGADGIDRIAMREYGEILLLDRDGKVLRAYPSPHEKLSWITITADAVLAGRIGDGGEPNSTIVRIDRKTLRSTTVVFPCRCADGADPFLLRGWITASSDVAIGTLVQLGSRAVGTPVQSWMGIVRVDLPSIEALFRRVSR
jgi:hypothetical protein